MQPMIWSYLILLLGAALGTVGFAILFNVPRRVLPFTALVGMAGQLVNQLLVDLSQPPELAAFAGGVAVGLMAEVGARLFRAPVTVFSVTGFIPLVPGTLAFQAVKAFLDDEVLGGIILAVRTMIQGGAIAAGLGVTAAVSHLRRRQQR